MNLQLISNIRRCVVVLCANSIRIPSYPQFKRETRNTRVHAWMESPLHDIPQIKDLLNMVRTLIDTTNKTISSDIDQG